MNFECRLYLFLYSLNLQISGKLCAQNIVSQESDRNIGQQWS